MPPRVSINLCCYNGEKFLEETLGSILLQTYKDWELVVVNDGSTDSTERIIRRHETAGWPIRYQYQKNAGLGRARNKALELSSGEYVAFIDQDDLWVPEKLAKQVRTLDSDASLGLVYSDCYYIDQDGKELGTAFKRTPPPSGDPFVGLLTYRNFIPCVTVLVSREAVRKVGTFDPGLKFVEDYDLFLKLSFKYGVACIQEPLARYRIHAGNIGGIGSLGMTREALQVLKRTVKGADFPSPLVRMRIRKRQIALWCKLIALHLTRGDLLRNLPSGS